MPPISQDIINKVKDHTDIVHQIGKYLRLTKKGRNYTGICPFHADKAPSLTVSPQKRIYTCFACGASGDVINFVKEHEHISFSEAIKRLAKDAHITIPEISQTPEEVARQKQRETLYTVLETAQKQFQENLSGSDMATTYLHARALNQEMLQTFRIGFAAAGNRITRDFPNRGYKSEFLIAAGLSAVNEDRNTSYDVFRERIIFPYLDLYGRVIGFTGRVLEDSQKTAKYLNTSDTPLFNKGNVLFSLYQSREFIIKANKVYLLEGQFDVVSLFQRGVRNVVCGSGTALTDAQARLLKRFTNCVVMVYDADAAGLKASIANAKTLLAHSFDVKAILLPVGQDPDDFAKLHEKEDISLLLHNRERHFIEYFYEAKNVAAASDFESSQLLDQLCDCIAMVPDEYLRDKYSKRLSNVFNTSLNTIRDRIKPVKELKIQHWKHGFYGQEQAAELLSDDANACNLVFTQDEFLDAFSESPTILAVGTPTLSDIQALRTIATQLYVTASSLPYMSELVESSELLLLKNMHKNGFDILLESNDEVQSFTDFYVSLYGEMISSNRITDSTKIAECIGRCAEVVSHLDPTVLVVMKDVYSKKLGLKNGSFDKILKPFLAKKKDKAMIDTQRMSELGAVFTGADNESVPEYVEKDKVLWNAYLKWGFYPLSDNSGRYFSYMFKNQQGSSHFPVADFYMKPLLHIYDESNDDANNKRVVQLCHMDKRLDKYIEWKSGIFANLSKVHEKLINAGPYNFFGTVDQYKRIWMNMSYGFVKCYPTNVLGQHPDGFFVFGNAIFHKVDGKFQIDYVNDLGVVSHDDTNYYLPAFSKIHLDRKNESDRNRYKLARNFMYREIPEDKQLSFSEWASLMDRVYSVNHNGKWALLFAVTCAFRDFIFDSRGEFTAPFFIGPTSSGKSKLAESIRNLFMDYKSAAFNLNTGTPAAFFMFVESLRNLPIVMEEYNDNDINPMIFQALKAATLDGQGRIKVADVASKTMDSSDINASLILLGQEAPQKDDGSLANRCIICDVPSRDFSEEENRIFEVLKEHEKNGLSNILLQVLELRALYEEFYLGLLVSETKKIKDAVKISVTNTEGLMRIINAVALMTATCRLLEVHAPHLQLPFSYAEFWPIAEQKVFSQVERISSTNKLSTYFQTISTLITHDKIKIGREIKLTQTLKVTRLLSGKRKEEVELPPDTKVLYIDFEGVYSYYQKEIGTNEALSRQSLTAYFNSNPAFIGLCNATRFKWSVAEHVGDSVEAIPNAPVESTATVVRANLRFVEKTKTTSAYMFNYNILKTLVDIDFERSDESKITKNITPADENDMPF